MCVCVCVSLLQKVLILSQEETVIAGPNCFSNTLSVTI